MKLSLLHRPASPASASPYRLVDHQGHEIAWANDFLDAQRIRQLSLRSLRAYGYDLLHFARWRLQHPSPTLPEMDESTLLDYVRDQLNEKPKPTPQTINHRLGVLRALYGFHSGHPLPTGLYRFQRFYRTRSPLGYGRPHPVFAAGLRLKEPKRLMMPLSADDVARFWSSFRTSRDLALIALMLLNGLRSQETLDLRLEDLHFGNAQLRVWGKGNKQRLLPLPPETIAALQNYLRLERPLTDSPALFVSLKGRHRGQAMTLAGLRSLFRHHRSHSRVPQANPHRFRHTFGADMVRAGISLPVLQQLMGHSQIRTTMLYVQLAPQDVWREYARAVQNRIRLSPPQNR
jgi:site-specific recombinase XerD